jgi:putative FmdB family regulatory protein
MPTYVYECAACAKVFEVEQRMSEEPLTDCSCGGAGTVRRLIQPAGVLFKGPGFYVNDSAQCPAPKAEAGCGEGCACKPAESTD